ncbi:asparagine synthetase B family protein [Lentisalinibacter salinarum]|uniref:hypothetical protein n=1 Tax=Lentisalinibacter salinarum TaxID=2992239 RepID=UPI00386E1F77
MIPASERFGVGCSASIVDERIHLSGQPSGFKGYRVGPYDRQSGIFVQWEVSEDAIDIWNDPLGFIPVFYTYDSCSFAFSTSICDLLSEQTTGGLDEAAIALFLRTGTYFGDRTPFYGIRVMPPGARIRFDRHGLSLFAPETPICGASSSTLSQANAVYGELFEAAIEKFRAVGLRRVAVPLSGGRDSRHILLELFRANIAEIDCLTVRTADTGPDSELSIASRLAGRLALPHSSVGPVASLIEAERLKNRLTNFCTLEHAWILPLADHLAGESYDAIFDGIGGDVLSQSKNLTRRRLELYRAERLEELADDVLGSEGYLPKMLARTAYRQFERAAAKELLISELRKYVDTPNPVGQFFFWNRTRRNIASSSWGILSRSCPTYAPYLDQDLYLFLSSLPAEFLLERRFHDTVISERYPEYADVDYASGSRALRSHSPRLAYAGVIEWGDYFRRNTVRGAPFRWPFIFARLLKSLSSPDFYGRSFSAFSIPLYLNELQRAAIGE